MSRLDELIQQYCPDGVAYVALETVCLISKGIQFNKKDMHDEGTYAFCVLYVVIFILITLQRCNQPSISQP